VGEPEEVVETGEHGIVLLPLEVEPLGEGRGQVAALDEEARLVEVGAVRGQDLLAALRERAARFGERAVPGRAAQDGERVRGLPRAAGDGFDGLGDALHIEIVTPRRWR